MKRYKQFRPVITANFETAVWRDPPHNHNHYELIFIKHGSGLHRLNRETFPYSAGDIFLLGPEDYHSFEIADSTRFIYLKFLPPAQAGFPLPPEKLQETDRLLQHQELRHRKITLTAHDKTAVAHIYDVVAAIGNTPGNEDILYFQLLSLLALLQRNINTPLHGNGQTPPNGKLGAILAYIHEHIYHPELLKQRELAARFHTTENYIGPYFKRNMGLTLRAYIFRYRMELIRERLQSGVFSKKEIAAEFGFTDESHLIKALKRHTTA